MLSPLGSSVEQDRGLPADEELFRIPLADCVSHNVLDTSSGLLFQAPLSQGQLGHCNSNYRKGDLFLCCHIFLYQYGFILDLMEITGQFEGYNTVFWKNTPGN